MKKIFFGVFFVLCFYHAHAQSQLEKDTWLIAGSGGFSSAKNLNSTVVQSLTKSDLSFSPSLGYFVVNRFAMGLIPSYSFSRREQFSSTTGNNISTTSFNGFFIGPYIRYYLMKGNDVPANVFVSASYRYGVTYSHTVDEVGNTIYKGETNAHNYSAAIVPVFFLTSSVGLEIPLEYTFSKGNYNGMQGTFKMGFGFNVYLKNKKSKSETKNVKGKTK